MNRIEVKSRKTIYGHEENCWFVDGRALPEHLGEWAKESDSEHFASMSFDGLCPAWSRALDYEGDRRFVWKTIEMDKALVPLLLCEDDMDFSCIVIVVETEKIGEYVYWNRIGYVTHDNEDWEQYGDNIACVECGSVCETHGGTNAGRLEGVGTASKGLWGDTAAPFGRGFNQRTADRFGGSISEAGVEGANLLQIHRIHVEIW